MDVHVRLAHTRAQPALVAAILDLDDTPRSEPVDSTEAGAVGAGVGEERPRPEDVDDDESADDERQKRDDRPREIAPEVVGDE